MARIALCECGSCHDFAVKALNFHVEQVKADDTCELSRLYFYIALMQMARAEMVSNLMRREDLSEDRAKRVFNGALDDLFEMLQETLRTDRFVDVAKNIYEANASVIDDEGHRAD